MVKEGAKGQHATTYYGDGIEGFTDAVVHMLNTAPHPDRMDVARHQKEQGDESDSIEDALDAVAQIKIVANEFEGKYLPVGMVGAIEGYCNRIERRLRGWEQDDDR